MIVAESIFAEPLHCFAPFDVGEVRLMHRYLKQVDRVIGSSFLEGASSKLSIRWDGKGTLTIQHDHAGDEALLAIAGPLRQLFDDHEAGSAASLIALLKQHAREPGLRHGRAAINELKAFTRSIDGIKATMGDVALVDERLGPDGINRRREMTFGDIVKLYLYGDHLHWDGDKAVVLDSWPPEILLYQFTTALKWLAQNYWNLGNVVRPILAEPRVLAA